MKYERLLTVSNKQFLEDIIKSMSGRDNYFVKNVILKTIEDNKVEVKKLKNPSLFFGHNIFILNDELTFNLKEYEELLKGKKFYELSLLDCNFTNTQRKELAIAFDQETLDEAILDSSCKRNNWVCNYYPNKKIAVELGYYACLDGYDQNDSFIKMYETEFVGLAEFNDKTIALTNELELRNIAKSCPDHCMNLVIHNFNSIKAKCYVKKPIE